MAGILQTFISELEERNAELAAAREELARLAVSQERERFARDLHDLLGQTLSVIALKAELADRLLESEPLRARRELGDVQSVTRRALDDVREAVGGYRRPTLDCELDEARGALTAAGIELSLEQEHLQERGTLPADVEGVLAWAVREAATNVLRHSRAGACQITLSTTPEEAYVEVLDDGCGLDAEQARGGYGLTGLAERAAQIGGRLEAGPREHGGFALKLSVPL